MEDLQKVEASTQKVEEMVKEILKDELQGLDAYVSQVSVFIQSNPQIPDEDLNLILLNLPTYLYRLTEVAQRIEMQKGLSGEHAKYTKNDALLNATGTVADKTATAENAGASDRIVQLAYKMAADTVQSKIDIVMTMISAVKCVIQTRNKEKALTSVAGSSVGAF